MRLILQLFTSNIKIILILALLVRVIWACLIPVDPVSDSFLYNEFAKSIASGNGYAYPSGEITVYWPVGTSAIYAILFKLFGVSFVPIVVFNVLIGLLIVWLTYEIAQHHFGKNTAQIAALLVACWPILIQFTTILASELIFILFVLAAIYIWGTKKLSPVIRAVIWGALICAATYVRPTALPLLAILPALDWLAEGKFKACVLSFFVAAITAALLFAPWVYRNLQQFGEPVLVSANGGVNLWMGNNPESNGGYNELPNLQFKNEVVRDQYFKGVAIKFIKDNPQGYLKLAALRAVITYKAETIGIVWNGYLEKNVGKPKLLAMKLVSSLYWWLMLALAGLGIYKGFKNKKIKIFHPLLIVLAFFFVFPILTVAQDRYHLPINPFLAMFAAYALQQFLDLRLTKQHSTKTAI
jgi:4-amino-4-deoxy-L-arabinose transferase-like glycosyltransferase